jgi:hypothetical protein
MKDYLLQLLHLCSDQDFGQRAVEYGIIQGHVTLTYHLQTDLRLIMGEAGRPGSGLYDQLCASYRTAQSEVEDMGLPILPREEAALILHS